MTPLGSAQWNDRLSVEGFVPQSKRDALAWMNEVGASYFQTLGTTMVAGRDFNAEDRVGSKPVAIVDETMASHFFHGVSPIGRVFRPDRGATLSDPIEIIGVVKAAKYRSLRETPQATVYLSMSQDSTIGVQTTIELKVSGDAQTIIPGVKSALSEVSPTLTVSFKTLASQVNGSLTRERVLATLSAFFGGLALLLATLGLYGVMSYNVARRRNEIGIRMALGAGQRRVTTMVLGNVGVIVAVGLVLGVALSLATTRFLATFLFGVTTTDRTTIVAAMGVLAAVALLAAYLPARRAARVDPMDALREQ
jgi:predicted permease